MAASLKAERPWIKLCGFIFLSLLLMFIASIVIAIVMRLLPGFADQMELMGPLPDTPMRLVEESRLMLATVPVLGSLALAILGAAALTYGRRLTDFAWPGRSFNAWDLGVGFLAMSCVGVVLMPIYMLMGAEWTPPILNPLYENWTRPVFVLAGVVGLLGAAAAEEVVFRGVLLRLTSQVIRHPLVLCFINGVLFSAVHLDPDPVAFVARALSGAVWTWAALRLGGLEFAIGAHLANNLILCLFWTPLSEIVVARDSAWIDLVPEVLTAVIMILIIERLADGPRDWRPARLAPRRPA